MIGVSVPNELICRDRNTVENKDKLTSFKQKYKFLSSRISGITSYYVSMADLNNKNFLAIMRLQDSIA